MTDLRSSTACCGVLPTPAVEDALRTIFVLSGRDEPVSTSVLALRLGVSAPTVSSMLKRLSEHGLLDRTPDHRAVLTSHGAGHARHVVRRHRILETFLVQVLGMSWEEVHREADLLEHAVSDQVLDRMDALLGRPARDPHGDPIPRGDDDHDEDWGTRLDDAPAGTRFVVERVYDREGRLLRHLAQIGVRPGVRLDVGEHAPFGGPVWIRVEGQDHALSESLARVVHGRADA
jgi:DtxR family Mn-dependent transcriptional regulator